MRALKKAVKKFLPNNQPPNVIGGIGGCIGELKVDELVSLRLRGFAKSGNISLSGRIGDKKVKLSSMFTEDQVSLRLRVLKMSDAIHLPRVLASEGRMIIEEWIDGRSPGREDHERIRQAIRDYLCNEERFSFGCAELCDFNYLDYLEQRVSGWYFLRGLSDFLENWREQRASLAGEMRLALCNPDITFANLIIESGTGRIVMIDTEFLHVGEGWFMDHPNSAVGNEIIDLGMPPALSLFAENTWRLRTIGSALIEGRPDSINLKMLEFKK